jgi:hypothetical protein
MSDLRRLAEQAHAEYPEKWHVSNAPALPVTMTVYGYAAHDFIAACDPQTILTLLDERDRYREALEFILGEFDDADFEHDPVPTTARDALGPEAAWIDAGSARRREECDGCGRMMQADEGFETDDGGVWCADCRATAIATRALEGG